MVHLVDRREIPRHIVFLFAWDFPVYVSGDGQKWPRKELGHYHSNFYQGADAIALDCRVKYRAIRAGVDAWFRRMWDESNLPEWMRRQILISTSHMAYNGVFFKSGQAAMKEGDCFPLVGTYDEQFHPSINPKSENRNPKWASRTHALRISGFGLRI